MSDLYELKAKYRELKNNKENIEYPLVCLELLNHMPVLSHKEIYSFLKEVITYLPLHELNDEQKQALEKCKQRFENHRYNKYPLE